MKITVLGYWGAFPWNHEGTSSYLIQSAGFSLLVDVGSSTLNVLQEQIDPLTLDSVILSHYHHDHIADLGVLQYYRQLKPAGQKLPVLPIYGHQEDMSHFADLTLPGVSEGRGYKEDEVLEVGPFAITFLRTVHPVTCFAMRIEERATGKCLLYSADSGYLSDLAAFTNKADVLIADTYLFEGQEGHHAHLTSKEVGELAQAAQVKTVVLSHLPQASDLTLLKKQAEHYAGPTVEILLASQQLSLTI